MKPPINFFKYQQKLFYRLLGSIFSRTFSLHDQQPKCSLAPIGFCQGRIGTLASPHGYGILKNVPATLITEPENKRRHLRAAQAYSTNANCRVSVGAMQSALARERHARGPGFWSQRKRKTGTLGTGARAYKVPVYVQAATTTIASATPALFPRGRARVLSGTLGAPG